MSEKQEKNQEKPVYIAENETTDTGMDTFFADSPVSANQNTGTVKQGMSRNLKILIAGILVLVILGAALTILLLLSKQQEDSQPIDTDSLAEQLLDDEDKAILVNPEKSEDVQEIEISHSGNSENFRVYLQTPAIDEFNAIYTIEGLEDVTLDTGLISTLVNNASELSANSLVTENIPDSELSKYGLDQPLADVIMHYTDDTDFAFSVGNPFPMDNSATYCLINQNLYLVKTSLMANYQKASSSFVSSTILEDPGEENQPIVETLRIARENLDYDIVLEYDEETASDDTVGGTASHHKMIEPVPVFLNVEKSSDIISSMFGLTAVEVAQIHPSESDLIRAGIDHPFCTVTMQCNDSNQYILHFGNSYTTENGTAAYYAYLEGVNLLYGVSESRAVWTSVLPGDIHSANIFNTYVWDIADLDIVTDSQELHFSGTGTEASNYTVTKNGETCDTERFRLLYRFLLNIYGDELFFETELPAGDPDVEISLRTQDGKENYKITFYQTSALNGIIACNDIPTYKIRSSCIETIRHNLEIFDNPDEEFILTWQ
ncbi:MAG: DUF4340 domain-containing protein [Oscillospiraceae bacterium]|nr:DUF4340 domain-containing protein [Oscillospiraceae bacterium]